MKRTYKSQSMVPDDDLSVIFNKVNTTYSGLPKQLVPNYTDDGYIYIIIYASTSATSKTVTILACDNTNIRATTTYTFERNVPLNCTFAAIDKHLCLIDSSTNDQNYSYKLKEFVFDDSLNTITQTAGISAGDNFPHGLGAAYKDNSDNIHYIINYNNSTNNIADYNLTASTYGRQNSGTHRFASLLTNNYNGVANQKAFVLTYLYNANCHIMTLAPEYSCDVTQNKFQQISNNLTATGNSKISFCGYRYRNHELFRCFVLDTSTTWVSNSYKELLMSADCTTISWGPLVSSTNLVIAAPPLYVNDALTEYWTIRASDFDFVLIDENE